MNVCQRPGCGELTKSKYCSRDCANKDKARMREVKASGDGVTERIQVLRSGAVPSPLEKVLVDGLGYENVQLMLHEMELQRSMGMGPELQMAAVPQKLRTTQPIWANDYFNGGPELAFPRPGIKPEPPTASEIEPYTKMYRRSEKILADFRRDKEIPWEDVERMQRSGPCMLAVRMKKAPLIAALSGRRKWRVKAADRKLGAVTGANVHSVLLKNIQNMLQCMDYGVSFGSMTWSYETAEKIGVVEKGVGKQTKWYVVDRIDWAHPTTVTQILRDNEFRFAGFEHSRKNRDPRLKIIAPPGAFVLTYGGLFGNMYGTSIYDPIYDFWFWYEVVLRSFLRYLERMGTPVAVCYAPQKGQTTRPDGTTMSNAQYALLVAGYAAHHSALFMPSDTFPDTGKPMWRLEYLPADQRGEQFVKALQYLGTQIMRGVAVGDRAITQDSEVGSYASASIHDKNTAIDNDAIFKDLLGQVNDYWIKRYAQFNADYNSPPLLKLEAHVLDPLEREILMKLFATAGNVKVGDGTPMDRINWEVAFSEMYAPILTDEEMEEQRKKRLEDSIEAQKERMKAMPKQPEQSSSGPFQKGAQGNAGQNGKQGQPAQATPDQKVRASIAQHLYEGGMVPVLVSAEDAMMLARPVQDSITLSSGDLELRRLGPKEKQPTDPEFEKKHPRDAGGKFAKKEEEGEDDEEGDEGEGDDRDKLDREPWPGADSERGIKGIVTLDGVRYTVQDGVSEEELLKFHDVNLSVKNEASEMGYDFSDVPVTLLAKDEFLAAGIPVFEWETDKSAYGITIDVGMIGSEDLIKPTIFHESLHALPRDGDSARGSEALRFQGAYLDYEEIAVTSLTMQYAEKHGYKPVADYQPYVSPAFQAAENLGMDKQAYYSFIRDTWQMDGDQYLPVMEAFFERGNAEKRYNKEVLDRWLPDRVDIWNEIISHYDEDREWNEEAWASTSW